MIEMIRDLETLEVMLGGIQDGDIRSRFQKSIEDIYLDIYERQLTDEERYLVDQDVRSFDIMQEGWVHVEDIFRPGDWICKVYQHDWWGHWRVEVWGNLVRMPDWDGQFEKEEDARHYAWKVASGNNRPWR